MYGPIQLNLALIARRFCNPASPPPSTKLPRLAQLTLPARLRCYLKIRTPSGYILPEYERPAQPPALLTRRLLRCAPSSKTLVKLSTLQTVFVQVGEPAARASFTTLPSPPVSTAIPGGTDLTSISTAHA
ncbi:hypothetical protein ACJQWK_07665 [Exserohilum turcicum]